MNVNTTASGYVPESNQETLNGPSFIQNRLHMVEETTQISQRSANYYKSKSNYFIHRSNIASDSTEKVSTPIEQSRVLTGANQRKVAILRLKALQARIELAWSAVYCLMDSSRHKKQSSVASIQHNMMEATYGVIV